MVRPIIGKASKLNVKNSCLLCGMPVSTFIVQSEINGDNRKNRPTYYMVCTCCGTAFKGEFLDQVPREFEL